MVKTLCNQKVICRGLFFAVTITCAGCSTRAFTPPRSDLLRTVDPLAINAQPVSTPEEDQSRFQEYQDKHRSLLLQLIAQRGNGDRVADGYRIGSGDELEINVFDVPELNLTTRVRDSGFINLPLIGAVQAKGSTENALVEELRHRLASFVRSPQVSVFITQYGSQKVSVVGAVAKPGTYALKKGQNSIIELLSEAGGVSQLAGNYLNFVPGELTGLANATDSTTRARLALESQQRAGSPTGGSIEIPLDAVLGTSGGVPVDVPVRGGDMIVVPEAGTVTVEGEVQKNGSYELGRRSSVLGALAASGGITYAAKIDEVEVVRDLSPEERIHLIVDLKRVATGEERDLKLRNGDVVRVPSDSGRRLTQDTYETLGRLINIGVGGQVNVLH